MEGFFIEVGGLKEVEGGDFLRTTEALLSKAGIAANDQMMKGEVGMEGFEECVVGLGGEGLVEGEGDDKIDPFFFEKF